MENGSAPSVIKVQSKDGGKFVMSKNAAALSSILASLMEDEAEELPPVDVDSSVLEKIIEFCEHHVKDPMDKIEKVCF
jgi:S-phase kinase-associated protein 1